MPVFCGAVKVPPSLMPQAIIAVFSRPRVIVLRTGLCSQLFLRNHGQTEMQALQPVIDRLKVGFPVYWYGESAVQKFSLFAIPMIFWVQNGQIVEKLPGRRSKKELDKKIRKFLAE